MHGPNDDNPTGRTGDGPDLGEDLRRLYAGRVSIPPDVDAAMRASIAERWPRSVGHTIRWRNRLAWAGAAAALLVAAVWLNLPRHPHPARQMAEADRVEPADIDGDGQVNILDAYQLARRVSAGQFPKPGSPRWHDVNGDGAMNRLDVDAVAYRAVSLEGRPG